MRRQPAGSRQESPGAHDPSLPLTSRSLSKTIGCLQALYGIDAFSQELKLLRSLKANAACQSELDKQKGAMQKVISKLQVLTFPGPQLQAWL